MELITENEVTFRFTPWQLLRMKQLFERKHSRILSDSEVMGLMCKEYQEDPKSPLLVVETISIPTKEGE